MLCLQPLQTRHLQPSYDRVCHDQQQLLIIHSCCNLKGSCLAIQVAAQMNDHIIADEPDHVGLYMPVALCHLC